jgi:hypothetical protein
MRFAQRRATCLTAAVSAAGLVAVALAGTLAPPALAGPLDEQTCEQLKREVADLEGLGAREHLGKGAAWGKGNLNSRQLEQVKKLIEIDEAIAFRCPRARPVPVVAAAVPAKAKRPPKGAPKVKPEAAKVKPGEVAKAATAKGQANSAQSPSRPAPQTKAPSAKAPQTQAAGDGRAAAAQAPAKPRPKPQDAFTPPQKSVQPAQ